jgi:hypothetical protein
VLLCVAALLRQVKDTVAASDKANREVFDAMAKEKEQLQDSVKAGQCTSQHTLRYFSAAHVTRLCRRACVAASAKISELEEALKASREQLEAEVCSSSLSCRADASL